MGEFKPEGLDFKYGKLEVVDKNRHDPGEYPDNDSIEFVFNPSKLSLSAQGKWDQPAQAGNKKATTPTYTGPEPQSLDFEFILDSWEASGPVTRAKDRSVSDDIDTLVSWTRPTKSTRDTKKPRPPLVRLNWGHEYFVAYVATITTTLTMFDKDGNPVRATVKVTLKEAPKLPKGQNPTSGSRVGHQSCSVVSGDSLASIAQRHYDDPRYWRGLAAANDIDDPRQLRPGTRLYLPPLTDVAASS